MRRKPSVYDRLTDVRNYTGMYRERYSLLLVVVVVLAATKCVAYHCVCVRAGFGRFNHDTVDKASDSSVVRDLSQITRPNLRRDASSKSMRGPRVSSLTHTIDTRWWTLWRAESG